MNLDDLDDLECGNCTMSSTTPETLLDVVRAAYAWRQAFADESRSSDYDERLALAAAVDAWLAD